MDQVSPPRSVSDLAAHLEKSRADLAKANDALATAKMHTETIADIERLAYRAFNEAVAAMRPKRKPKAVKP